MSRYVRGTTPYDDATLDLAESLFERYVGRRLSCEEYEENVVIRNNRGSLSHSPLVRIKRVKATIDAGVVLPWSTDADIAPASVYVEGTAFALPASLFGVSYSSAHVVYDAGIEETPAAIERVVLEIASLLSDKTMTEWSGVTALSDEAQAVIAIYAKGR